MKFISILLSTAVALNLNEYESEDGCGGGWLDENNMCCDFDEDWEIVCQETPGVGTEDPWGERDFDFGTAGEEADWSFGSAGEGEPDLGDIEASLLNGMFGGADPFGLNPELGGEGMEDPGAADIYVEFDQLGEFENVTGHITRWEDNSPDAGMEDMMGMLMMMAMLGEMGEGMEGMDGMD